MAKILVVEDNADLSENIRDLLESHQYNVDCAMDGIEALGYLRAYEYDVIVLDWVLPKMTGIEIVKHSRLG